MSSMPPFVSWHNSLIVLRVPHIPIPLPIAAKIEKGLRLNFINFNDDFSMKDVKMEFFVHAQPPRSNLLAICGISSVNC